MKKKTKIIIAFALACAGTLVLGACKGDDNPHLKHPETVSVRFDPNGGAFNSRMGVYVTDRYPLEEVKKGIKLLPPEYEGRMPNGPMEPTRSGYFLAGWYEKKELRTDGNGNPVDEDGNLCSVSGKEQSYTYSDPWDFEKDVFQRDEAIKYEEGVYDLTLYAAWIPFYTYRLWGEVETAGGGTDWEVVATYSYNPERASDSEIPVPEWNEETGALDYGKFPDSSKTSGKTYVAVYADKSKSEALTSITHPGTWDPATGTTSNNIKDYYGDFLDGVWFKISNAKQLVSNARANGCYEILDDLTFSATSADSGVTWPLTFANGDFSGTFVGNGHTITGAAVTQSSNDMIHVGLFGTIQASAKFTDISFENISFNLQLGSRRRDAEFGLFTGNLSNSAVMENVSVSGKITIGAEVAPQSYGYTLGLLSGNFVTKGISLGNITVECEKDSNGKDVNKAEIGANGRITFTPV